MNRNYRLDELPQGKYWEYMPDFVNPYAFRNNQTVVVQGIECFKHNKNIYRKDTGEIFKPLEIAQ